MKMHRAAASAIAAQLAGVDRLLITAHRDPDGDSIGCQLAFYEYWTRQKGRKADVLNHGALPLRYRFLDPDRIIRPPRRPSRKASWQAAILFECSTLDRIGSVRRFVPPNIPIISIDHHQSSVPFGTVNVIDTSRSACAEMVFDLLRLWKAEITPNMAQLLAAAILTDTGRFHHPCTNVQSLATMTELVRHGANLNDLTNRIYYTMPPEHFRLTHHVLGRAALRAHGKICLLSLRASDRTKFRVPWREMEGLVDYSLSLNGVVVGALLKELGPRKTKISLRSPGRVDVAALAQRFGGGGHKNAAGYVIDLPLREAAEALVKAVGPLTRKTGPARRGSGA